MIRQAIKKGQLYVNYLGPSSALIGNLIATPILISNLGLMEWSLFALTSILLPYIYLVLFGSSEILKREMINIFLNNTKTKSSIYKFYKYEKRILIKFFPALIFLSLLLILFNSDNYISFKNIEFSFFLISVVVSAKIFETFYSQTLSGLKQHYKLQIYSSIITILKWITIIYLSFLNEIHINYILFVLIIFSLCLLTFQRILISNIFEKKKLFFTNKITHISPKLNENSFGLIIILIWALQHFDKILIFGILDSMQVSFFAIAFMICSAVMTIFLPVIAYLTPEIYEVVELNNKNRKKIFYKIIFIQSTMMITILLIINLYLDNLLTIWLKNDINISEISSFLIPLSISTLSISIINSLKILFIAENVLIRIKKSVILVFCLLIILTTCIHQNFISVNTYLYAWSISLLVLLIYCSFIFFNKNYKN